jgi:hypothetical protein
VNKAAGRWIPIVIIAAIVFDIGLHVWGTHSDAYRYLKGVVRSSAEIHKRVGDVRSIRMGLLSGFSERASETATWATMTLIVDGNDGEVTVKAEVEENNGKWTTTEAWINGRETTLN